MKILAIGAHFDDIEIGVSQTIYKHIQLGDEVYFAIINSRDVYAGDVDNRFKEQNESCLILGIPQTNMFFFDDCNTISQIINFLDQLEPNIIFTHYIEDTHQDHRLASQIGQSVGRNRNITTYFYSVGSSQSFNPNVFSCFDNFQFKEKILNCFKSQIERGSINIDIIKKREAYWGSIVSENNEFAEGFITRKLRYKL